MKDTDNTAMTNATKRPNVLIILADDLGFADIGCYGGQIPTPNLDRLASHGLRFSQFYNTARCCPSRASLLTGLHPHRAGIGLMSEDPHWLKDPNAPPGYQRRLNRSCVTLAEVLGASGYHTYVAGKWHVGMYGLETWPLQRGFGRFYGILVGACSYLRPHGDRHLVLDNAALPPPQGDYYTTDAFTDFGIRCLKEQTDNAPFFLYMAYNAPHWPLQARQEDIDRFVGAYCKGWDTLREEIHRRQLDMGLVKEVWGLSARDEGARPWRDLTQEQQRQLDYRMAVYAAQVYRMDVNVGRLVKTLEGLGQLDNTLILFLSDNGGCAEPYTDLGGGAFEDINNPEKAGAISYGQGWANASNTPFRKFKVFVHEGGISTPLIAHWPAGIQVTPGAITETPAYLIDIMPTITELTGTAYPTHFAGHSITPMEGASLAPVFQNGARERPEWMFWEHANNCAARHGRWKAIQRFGAEKWELYDVEADRTERHDRAPDCPEIVEELAARWRAWAERCLVVPKPPQDAGHRGSRPRLPGT